MLASDANALPRYLRAVDIQKANKIKKKKVSISQN